MIFLAFSKPLWFAHRVQVCAVDWALVLAVYLDLDLDLCLILVLVLGRVGNQVVLSYCPHGDIHDRVYPLSQRQVLFEVGVEAAAGSWPADRS